MHKCDLITRGGGEGGWSAFLTERLVQLLHRLLDTSNLAITITWTIEEISVVLCYGFTVRD